ncbi:hypothetical protein CCO03_01700 [Comamonas serinivorans]|uniref:YaeQ family protein n=1 Tax=Comamonas serinivorans TaxID=1082851 RepID=A0A1Y0EJD3_9BURK|nr:YaeQ family protein [Comamonas serinivorans]ARU03570.1 hypothetical protein CCO03_01700 [Comamonas serinivorans]
MALSATIFKCTLSVADVDHGYYAEHALTLARHPSETDERMMVRLAALAFHAHAVQTVCQGDGDIGFGAGLSSPEDPDVRLVDFTGRKRLWIEVGQPLDKPLLKASQQSDAVAVYAYSHQAEIWWKAEQAKISRLSKVNVWRIPTEQSQALAALAERSMQLQATIQDGAALISRGSQTVTVEPERWQEASSR